MYKKVRDKKIVFGVLAALFFEATTNFNAIVYAAEPLTDAAKEAMALGVIGAAIMELANKIMLLIAGLVDFAVRLGNDVLTLPAVQSGWQIVLSFTNLGFVLGIIVIAFATILRMESYGMKQILWKLVVAALLVNFSLVIAGSIMSASNVASNVFYEASMKNNNLSNALGNAMAPQKFLQIKDASLLAVATDYVKDTFTVTGWIKYFINIFFVIIFTFLIILAFLTLFIMLLMRAIILAFLLIVSPIIWLLWIFPNTSQYWKQWWEQFVRWNFFAPAVYFFIYLAIMTAAGIQKAPLSSVTGAQSAVGSAANVFNDSGMISDIFTHIANLFVVLGLLFGGIYVANKFGIAGGSIGVNLAQGTGKAVGGWAGRKGTALASRPLRGKWGRGAVEKMQKWGAGRGLVGRTLSAPVRHLGTAVSGVGVQQGDKLVKDAEERLNKRFINDKNLANAWDTLSRDEKIAASKRFTKNKTMNLLSGEQLDRFIGDDGAKKIFERHGASKAYGDFEKSAGRNTEMVNAKTAEVKEKSAKEFYKGYSPEDIGNIRTNAILEGKDADAGIRFKALIETNPGALAKLMPKLSGGDFNTMIKSVAKATIPAEIKIEVDTGLKDDAGKPIMRTEIKKTVNFDKLDDKELYKEVSSHIKNYLQDETKTEYKNLYKSLSKNLANRMTGFIEMEKEKEEKT